MKTRRVVMYTLIACLSVTCGCSSEQSKMISNTRTIESILQSQTDNEDVGIQIEEIEDKKINEEDNRKIDLDLTGLSKDFIYAIVDKLNFESDNYLGKVVKVKGSYSCIDYNNNKYHVILVKDNLACCASQLEFRWAGEHKFPEDYPNEGQQIEITGVLETYVDASDGFQYSILNDTTIKTIEDSNN